VPPGWDENPVALLAFGGTHVKERAEAAPRRWPVKVRPGGHLRQLIDSGEVAAKLVALIGRLGIELPTD
jgi:hypothetical protein